MLSRHIPNIKSGVTVALVSIPLSISLAIVSGVAPTLGIITAVWAGLIGAIFGGSNYNIIGPTGALSGFIAAYAIVNGPETVPCLAVFVGIFIIIAYLFRLEKYLVLIPTSVIHGFTLGVACIIALSQIRNILPNYDIYSHDLWISLAIFVLFLCALILFKFIKFPIPGVIIVVPVGILIGWLSVNGVLIGGVSTLGMKYGVIVPKFVNFGFVMGRSPIIPALVIAIVAILETLLSAKIADSMTHTKHVSHKEVLGLGLANIVSGLVGGIPATAALARTALNIKSGAVDKYSAVISSIATVFFTALFISLFFYMPMPVIASILVYTAINMVEHEHFVRLYRCDKLSFFTALLVAIVTLLEDPIFGILIGTLVALLILVHNLLPGYYKKLGMDDVLIYSIKGELVYLNGDVHSLRFANFSKDYAKIIIKLRDLNFMDIDGVEVFDQIVDSACKDGKLVVIADVPENIGQLLRKASHVFKEMQDKGLIFANMQDALSHMHHDI